jgi:hypothetical protein
MRGRTAPSASTPAARPSQPVTPGPPPTKLGQSPQASTATQQTVEDRPRGLNRTTNGRLVVPAGGVMAKMHGGPAMPTIEQVPSSVKPHARKAQRMWLTFVGAFVGAGTGQAH